MWVWQHINNGLLYLKGAANNGLFDRFRRWIIFCDPHVFHMHCGSRKSSALNSSKLRIIRGTLMTIVGQSAFGCNEERL